MNFLAKFLSTLASLSMSVMFGQVGEQPLVIPGTELGWESSRLELVLRVDETAPVVLKVYSPGFDPNDYRSPNELGDERYDGGSGELRTKIRIFDDEGQLRLSKEYGAEPHRWYTLINGDLAAGDYLIDMQFFGNGKNALVFDLVAESEKVTLEVAPGSMQTYNVHGANWQQPFQVRKRDWSAPFAVGVYDGDGPEELEMRAVYPGGERRTLPAPGNREWTKLAIEREGTYGFEFRQPDTARQYTNTVGFQVFLGDVTVRVVDTSGRPVEGAKVRTRGFYDRTVELVSVPEGWTHVSTRARYGLELAPVRVKFGPGGGEVTFVLEPPSGTLRLSAGAVCGAESVPVPLSLKVGAKQVALNDAGAAEVKLPAGSYPVEVAVPGARVQAPAEVTVAAGEVAELRVELTPEIRVDLSAADALAGQAFDVRARATTDFPFELPGRLRLDLPEGLRAEGPTETQGILAAGRALELRTPVVADRPDTYHIRAGLEPCAAQAEATVEVRRPPRYTLTKTVEPTQAVPGDAVHFVLEVHNGGDVPGRVRLADTLPAGLVGDDLEATLDLAPGETRRVELAARVAEDARGAIVNTARLLDEDGRFLAEAQATLRVLEPQATLTRTLDKRVVVPGERVQVCLQVTNPGVAPLQYTLTDQPPAWILPDGAPSFEGRLLPGEEAEHCYPATVESGPEAEGAFMARLESNAGSLEAPDTIRRVPLGLAKSVDPAEVALGKTATFTLEVANPTDHVLEVRVVDEPEAGLGLEAKEHILTLEPGERRVLRYEAVPTSVGAHRNVALVYVGTTPATGPAEALLRVRAPLAASRESTVRMPFQVEARGDALLVRHAPPVGARYVPGSSRLNGQPFADPRVDDQGRLYWKVPYAPEGELSYALAHEGPLGPLSEPELTLLVGDRELALQGEPLLAAYRAARPLGGAAEAAAPAEGWAEPVKAVADGRTPIRVRLALPEGMDTAGGLVTLAATPEPRTPDADPRTSGYQVRLEGGVAEVELEPMASPGEAVLVLDDGARRVEERFYVPGPERTFWTAQGSVTARYDGAFELGGTARGYLEHPLGSGTLEAALDTQTNLTTSGLAYYPGLADEERPDRRFPLTGAGEEARQPLYSDDGVAVRYQDEHVSVGYFRTSLALPGLTEMPRSTALVGELRGDLSAGAFVALLPSTEVSEELVPDGSRVYRLSRPAQPGSERVVLRQGASEQVLEPLRDYTIDYAGALLTLAKPLWPYDTFGAPVRLVVTYAPQTAPRDTLAAGAGVGYQSGPFSFGASAATLDRGRTWKVGVGTGYTTETFGVSASLGLDAGRFVLGLGAEGRQGPWSARGQLRYDGQIQGQLRVARELSERDTVAFEHRGSSLYNRSSLLYERRFSERLEGGLGLGYEWTSGSPELVGRVGYRDELTQARLTHSQSFSVAPSLTVLSVDRKLDHNLTARSELAYAWGQGLSGTLGLDQRLGLANLSVDYVLPNASGQGNRARFGIEAPLPLGLCTTLDLFAGYEKDLAGSDYLAAAGVGLRYKSGRLSATVGVEGSTGSAGSKVTLRSGASGQIDDRQVISFDANYAFGGPDQGRFTLAYAYRGRTLQLLTYHRLVHEGGTQLEGEVAPTWHPSLAFQLRPNAAYRVDFADPAASLYQLGLGANYYFTRRLGFGAGAYYLWQPGASASHTAFNVEGSLRVLDPLWLNVGYTYGGFVGLTPESRPGVYLRLDFFGSGNE